MELRMDKELIGISLTVKETYEGGEPREYTLEMDPRDCHIIQRRSMVPVRDDSGKLVEHLPAPETVVVIHGRTARVKKKDKES